MSVLNRIDTESLLKTALARAPKRGPIVVSTAKNVGPEWMATATNGVDHFHAVAATSELAEQRALNGLRSVLGQ